MKLKGKLSRERLRPRWELQVRNTTTKEKRGTWEGRGRWRSLVLNDPNEFETSKEKRICVFLEQLIVRICVLRGICLGICVTHMCVYMAVCVSSYSNIAQRKHLQQHLPISSQSFSFWYLHFWICMCVISVRVGVWRGHVRLFQTICRVCLVWPIQV